ncbi:MAG: low-specificity L-threonine aldolase [Anaerolineae bacterium]|jgi:threonine aldolase|nr:low-specificity L-threonine aldolase [Anaerolineae bacterium]
MQTIDLRSDTVTWPTEAMRAAMAAAVVGDDVYGEDPTVNQLEHEAAALFGKEAGLFVTSGTQGNLAALLAHCERGSEIITGDKAHTFMYEAGGMAALGGIMPHTVPVQADGTLRLDDIRAAIRGNNEHFPRTRLITLENTQGTVGGQPLSVAYTQQVGDIARQHGLKFHIDGARIFNAAAAAGVPVRALAEPADSLTFCLSKGLCAPAGSVLVGSRAFIQEARRARKMLGGGLRQAGVLAAAGLIALHEMSQRLHEDHAHAACLAEGLRTVPGVRVLSQATNFVFFWLEEEAALSPAAFAAALRAQHIIVSPYPGHERKFRCVLHYWITRERVEMVIQAMRQVLG